MWIAVSARVSDEGQEWVGGDVNCNKNKSFQEGSWGGHRHHTIYNLNLCSGAKVLINSYNMLVTYICIMHCISCS